MSPALPGFFKLTPMGGLCLLKVTPMGGICFPLLPWWSQVPDLSGSSSILVPPRQVVFEVGEFVTDSVLFMGPKRKEVERLETGHRGWPTEIYCRLIILSDLLSDVPVVATICFISPSPTHYLEIRLSRSWTPAHPRTRVHTYTHMYVCRR